MIIMHAEPSAYRPIPGKRHREHLLMFRLGGRCYAMTLDSITSLSPPGRIRPVQPPTTGVLGITEWRGRLLTVLDLSLLLDANDVAPPLSLIHLAAPFDQTSLYLAGPVRLEACEVAQDIDPDVDGFFRFEFEDEPVLLVNPALLMERAYTVQDT
jgi:hypothetical protein